MPRKRVPLVPGEFYHVYNRGVDKRTIFSRETDYLRFYASLRDFNVIDPVGSLRDAPKQTSTEKINPLVSIVAYALLPNHFHLLVRQETENGLSEFMKRVQGGYTSHFNEAYERTGALLQGTYKRVHVDSDEYRNYIFCYVNENHRVHGLPEELKIYHTSSLHYQGILQSKVITQLEMFSTYNHAGALQLAQSIHDERALYKNLLLEHE